MEKKNKKDSNFISLSLCNLHHCILCNPILSLKKERKKSGLALKQTNKQAKETSDFKAAPYNKLFTTNLLAIIFQIFFSFSTSKQTDKQADKQTLFLFLMNKQASQPVN